MSSGLINASTTFLVLVIGTTLGRQWGARAVPTLWLTASVGVSVVVVWNFILALFRVQFQWSLYMLAVLCMISCRLYYRRFPVVMHDSRRLTQAATLLAISIASGAIARFWRINSISEDSFAYMTNARLAARNALGTLMLLRPENYESYAIGYPMLHLQSAWTDDVVNGGLALAVGAALISSLAALRGSVPAWALAVGFLLLFDRNFWMMLPYINGHTVVALLIAAMFVMLSSEQRPETRVSLALIAAALVLLRVENPFILLLFCGIFGHDRVLPEDRLPAVRAALIGAGVMGLIRQASVIWAYSAGGGRPSQSSLGLLAVAIVTLVSGYFFPRVRSSLPHPYVSVMLSLALVPLYAILAPTAFQSSTVAVLTNLFAGPGGWTLLPYVLAVTIPVSLMRTKDAAALNAPAAFFVAAASVLFFTALLRESPFRVGFGDSFNRAIFHLVPIVLIGTTQWLGSRGLQSRRRRTDSPM